MIGKSAEIGRKEDGEQMNDDFWLALIAIVNWSYIIGYIIWAWRQRNGK